MKYYGKITDPKDLVTLERAQTEARAEIASAIDPSTGTVLAKLVSGTNIKTINNESILGSGNIDVSRIPSITITLSLVTGPDPLTVQFTDEQAAIINNDANAFIYFDLSSFGRTDLPNATVYNVLAYDGAHRLLNCISSKFNTDTSIVNGLASQSVVYTIGTKVGVLSTYNVKPATKTSDMIQEVGIDSDGKFWTKKGDSFPTPAEAGDAMIYDGTAWTLQGDYGYRTLVPENVLISSRALTFAQPEEGYPYMTTDSTPEITGMLIGETYKVTWDGTDYTCIVSEIEGIIYIGNVAILEPSMQDTGEPFLYSPEVEFMEVTDVWGTPSGVSHTISISIPAYYSYTKINDGYIYPSNPSAGDAIVFDGTNWSKQSGYAYEAEEFSGIMDDSYGFTYIGIHYPSYPFAVLTDASVALYNTISEGKIYNVYWEDDNISQTYTCTVLNVGGYLGFGNLSSIGGTGNNEPFAYVKEFSMGGQSVEDCWIALTATQNVEVYLYVTGPMAVTHPFDYKFIKEGADTVATGLYSHVEGSDTVASGDYSHAEGVQTTSGGDCSHAEGMNTTAVGWCSHSEGNQTNALGSGAHAEGSGTIATGQYQHVQGKYNVEDSNSIYADIVGNGDDSNRSNASALDWNGNLRLKGDVYVGCNADSTGGTKLVTNISDGTGQGSIKTSYSVDAAGNYSFVEGYGNSAIGESSHVEGASYRYPYGSVLNDVTSSTTVVMTWEESEVAPDVGDWIFIGSASRKVLNVVKDSSNDTATLTINESITATAGTSINLIRTIEADCGDYPYDVSAAHAEGFATLAYGMTSHAEGNYSKALGDISHAEGYGTIAKGSEQHTQGRYNVVDSNNTYADIVGNGTYDSNRSNASALDWNGNLRLKGDVYVGCNADSTGGTKLGVPQVIEQTSPASITLQDNTEYYLTSVSNLTISYPSGRFDCWIDLVTGSSTPTITLPATSKYIGDEPNFGTNEEWEISIKNGRVVACKVED